MASMGFMFGVCIGDLLNSTVSDVPVTRWRQLGKLNFFLMKLEKTETKLNNEEAATFYLFYLFYYCF